MLFEKRLAFKLPDHKAAFIGGIIVVLALFVVICRAFTLAAIAF